MNESYCKEHGIFECPVCVSPVTVASLPPPVERGACAWSRNCSIGGPRVTIAGLGYCRAHAEEFSADRVLIKNTVDEDTGENSRNVKGNPLLLFPRKVIDLAIHEAKDCSEGEPTDEGLYQRAWIEAGIESREDLFGEGFVSFEWCCHWLSLDVDATRQRALDEIDAELAKQYLAKRRAEFSAKAMKLWGYQPRPEQTPRAEQISLMFATEPAEARR